MKSIEHSTSCPILGTFIFSILPALLCGCTSPDLPESGAVAESTIRLMSTEYEIAGMSAEFDLFMFNDDRMRRLDSYQRFRNNGCATLEATSTTGDKIAVLFTNAQREDLYDWASINSYSQMQKICAELEKEDEASPAMSGECRITAGRSGNIILQRLASEILLRSICCDFSGRPYQGQKIEDVKIYLTNVNAQAPLIHDGPYMPQRIINSGRLVKEEVGRFKTPSFILREMGTDIGSDTLQTDFRFRCYPNEAEHESPGTPFTRLVIEGRIGESTYYWPININRDNGAQGIGRNCRYIYDIKIRRTGNTDPDNAIEIEDAEIKMRIEEWEEKADYGVRF